jgi:hypothetical protein
LSNFTITQGTASGTKAKSTMFPDSCSQDAVIAAIQNAIAHGTTVNKQFRGPSGTGCQAGSPLAPFKITGFLDNAGEVITAYPDY